MRPVPTPPVVRVRVPAKVNLELRVGAMRPDGFHSLSTVFHAISLTDDVHISPAAQWECVVKGLYADRVPTGVDNLAVRAAQRLASRFGMDEALRITIDKRIPVAGGMAGGSADAAGALVAADAFWELGLSRAQLSEVAAEIGSDVPFALTGGTALGSGRGEQLAPVLSQGSFHWVFALQDTGLSTPQVYAECDRLRGAREVAMPEPSEELMLALRTGEASQVGAQLHNDLQPAALSLLPRLRTVLDTGVDAGACGAVVSGSGPTVAFLCTDRHAALDLMIALSASKVADQVVDGMGAAPGAHVVTDLHDA